MVDWYEMLFKVLVQKWEMKTAQSDTDVVRMTSQPGKELCNNLTDTQNFIGQMRIGYVCINKNMRL